MAIVGGINRVSDTWRLTTMMTGLRHTSLRLGQAQQQLATGDRLLRPSDDPAAASGAMSLQRVLETQAQTLANIRGATTLFNLTDQALGDVSSLLLEAQTIASTHLSTGVTPQEREQASQLVQSLIDRMLNLANTRNGEVYIFGGTANSEAPFVSESGGIRYLGQNQATLALLGGSQPTQLGLTGAEVFGGLSSEVLGVAPLTPRLTAETRLADMSGIGQGIRLGTLVIDDGTLRIEVDLAGCDRFGDVVDRINQAGGGVITAAIGGGHNLQLASTSPGADLTVSDIGGQAARDLRIATEVGQGPTLTGLPLGPRLTLATPTSHLSNGWTGMDLASGIVITNGPHSATLSFAGTATLGDILNRINSADVGALARINAKGTGIDIVNTLSGSEMRIGENGGRTAEHLGIRSLRPTTLLTSLNGGLGVRTQEGPDIAVTARDGQSFQVDLSDAKSVSDVTVKINLAALMAGVPIHARLSSNGGGIELVDSTGGAGPLAVAAVDGSDAAEDLGLAGSANADTLVGRDVSGTEPDGVFAHLIQLRDALQGNDSRAITRAAEALDGDYRHVVGQRARVGGLVQDLQYRQQREEDQNIVMQATLSELKDVDFAEAAVRFQALMTAMQANLTSGSQILNMSLLDFLR